MSTRVAIAGCGRMGAERARRVFAHGGRVAAFVDPVPERAGAFAREYGSLAAASVDELPWDDIDAVFVCTPPAGRVEMIRRIVQHGCALFIEKPLAANLIEASAIAGAVREANTIAAVGYMNRYRPGIAHAQELVRSVGGLLGISGYWAGGRYRVPWWPDAALSGGAINEQATHLLDVCRVIGGEIAEISAISSPPYERAAVALAFTSGAAGSLLYTCEAPAKSIGLRVLCERGTLAFDGWDFRLVENTVDGRLFDAASDPFDAEVAGFLHAVRTSDRNGIRCDVDDALKTHDATQRVIASARGRLGVPLAS